jgi:hypothetical protein
MFNITMPTFTDILTNQYFQVILVVLLIYFSYMYTEVELMSLWKENKHNDISKTSK